MSRRLLDWDGSSDGLAHFWHEDGDGWAQETVQDATNLLDLNREARNHCDPRNAAGDVRMVARIPFIIMAKWRNELGVDYWNPDHQAKVDALLADPEWAYLRTDTGSAGRTQVLMGAAAGIILNADGTPMKGDS